VVQNKKFTSMLVGVNKHRVYVQILFSFFVLAIIMPEQHLNTNKKLQ